MDIRFLYVTVGTREEAELIGRQLVEERIAACVNLLGPMQSYYWWKNQVQSDQETVLIAKTTQDKVPLATKRIRELHSYSCPCVVALPVVDGNEDFLAWIRSETQSPQGT